MKREIKFRDYSNEYHKWVYGYLTCDIPLIYSLGGTYKVDKNSIGQYTGLHDKNGVEIYEGDKVKAKFFGKDVVGEIGFASGCFLLWNSCVIDNQLFIFSDIEVIGNIYEKGDR